MTVDFDPAYLEDQYRTVLVSMLRGKRMQPGERASLAAPSRENVISPHWTSSNAVLRRRSQGLLSNPGARWLNPKPMPPNDQLVELANSAHSV
jgi:hypothetical protein